MTNMTNDFSNLDAQSDMGSFATISSEEMAPCFNEASDMAYENKLSLLADIHADAASKLATSVTQSTILCNVGV
jgi:hypothetical protein